MQPSGCTCVNLSKAVVGHEVPAIKAKAVVEGNIVDFDLNQWRGKWGVLFFYPRDFTFVCPTEIIAFNDRAEEFRALNCEVAAISTDSENVHWQWCATPRKDGGLCPMKIPVIADPTHRISREYGVLVPEMGAALRGLFLFDRSGILKHITINDLPVGRSVDEALRVLQAFQFVETHGEVCPAGWRPGQKTMVPTPEGLKAYHTT
ncbi:putative Thioredoxin peroxidase [Paratrimastix pyriformis]|uniref:Thioredoxin peroxidase n=1 Tax=Paratrimastix pyriformis TaxID=342808 RepID=A0ABQ8UD85_9EUKA|nr:putative Thioredoxin peroxidase [Paratrimastix pyriformis]